MKVLVVPLYLGEHFDGWDKRSGDIDKVKKYLKRALMFFGTREGLTILYPEDRNQVCYSHVHYCLADEIIIHPNKVRMDAYMDVDNLFYGDARDEPVRSQIVKELSRKKVVNAENLVVFINMNHVSQFIRAYKDVHGPYAKDMSFNFYSIGEVGNTDAFFFDKDNKDSIEYLKFNSHLDFFIPEKIGDLTTEIMKCALKVHTKIKLKGRTSYLRSLAEAFA